MKVTTCVVVAAIAITTAHAGTPETLFPTVVSDPDASCSDYCLDVMRPVYDEDGNVYSNECYMKRAKCKHKKKDVNIMEEYKRLYGKSFGASRDEDSASEDSASYEDDSASEGSGSSSEETKVKSTKSPNKAAKKSSASSSGIGSLYDDGSNGVIDTGSDETLPEKKCASGCPDVELPVCGSDGVMYSNPCELKIADCQYPERHIVEAGDEVCSEVTTQDEAIGKKSTKTSVILH